MQVTANNRIRIVALLLASTANYFVTAAITGAVLGVLLVVWGLGETGFVPTTGDEWTVLGTVTLVIAALGMLFAIVAAFIGLPGARRKLESVMLIRPRVSLDGLAVDPRLGNIVEALAMASGIQPPHVAIIDDPAPNSFSIGTRPHDTVIAVTAGLLDVMTRPQLEAIVAYEITRVASLDVALTTWVVALTAQVGSTTKAHSVTEAVGTFNRRFASRLRSWALRDNAAARDRAAIARSKNPAALVAALERLEADPRVVVGISPETAALWIEVPESLLNDVTDRTTRAELTTLLLRERIGALRHLAALPPS